MFGEDYYVTMLTRWQKFTKYVLPWIVFATIIALFFLALADIVKGLILISAPVERALELL